MYEWIVYMKNGEKKFLWAYGRTFTDLMAKYGREFVEQIEIVDAVTYVD